MTSSLLTAICVALPVVAAGLIHVAVIRAGFFPGLARIPLDGGISAGGRPLLGANKTLRGALVMPAAYCAAWRNLPLCPASQSIPCQAP